MVKQLKRAAKSRREEQRQVCRDFAAAIIESWQPGRPRYSWHDTPDETDRSVFPSLLQELDDPTLVRRFLAQVMAGDGEVQLDKSFPAFCKRHGWPSFEAELTAVIGAASATTIDRNAALLQILCMNRDKSAERIELCRRLADRAAFACRVRRPGGQERLADQASRPICAARFTGEIDAGRCCRPTAYPPDRPRSRARRHVRLDRLASRRALRP